MSYKVAIAGLMVVSLGIVSEAHAETGAYGGISLGNASLEGDAYDSAMGWRISAGYELNSYVAVEGGYTSFGEMDGPTFMGNKISAEPTGFELAAVGSVPVNGQVSLLGKLGVLAWDLDIRLQGQGSTSRSGTDVFYGVGGKYSLNDGVSLRASWERYTVEDADLDFFSGSVVFSF